MIWLICYFLKRELSKREIIYLCAVTMSVFFLTVKLHPQWAILLVPYITLIIIFNLENMKENFILEAVFSIGFVLNKAINYCWTCNLNLLDKMMGPQSVFRSADDQLSGFGLVSFIIKISELLNISVSSFAKLFKAMVVTGLVFFLIWNYKGINCKAITGIDYLERRKWLGVRFLLSCLIGILPLTGIIVYMFA